MPGVEGSSVKGSGCALSCVAASEALEEKNGAKSFEEVREKLLQILRRCPAWAEGDLELYFFLRVEINQVDDTETGERGCFLDREESRDGRDSVELKPGSMVSNLKATEGEVREHPFKLGQSSWTELTKAVKRYVLLVWSHMCRMSIDLRPRSMLLIQKTSFWKII